MDKIASPQDLQAELRGIMAYVHASERPDRQVVASKLNDLADRVAATARQVSYAMFLLAKVDWERSGLSKGFRGLKVKPDEATLSKMSTARLSKLIDVLKKYIDANPQGVSQGYRLATPRQKEYIAGQLSFLGPQSFRDVTGIDLRDYKDLNTWTLEKASKAIDALKRAEKARREEKLRAQPQPQQTPPGQPSRGRPATPRQIDYAMNLLRRLGPHGWHDSDAGQGMAMPRRQDLEGWSAPQVSALIDSLRGEF